MITLGKAFQELRKRGIYARANYQCCTSCGCAAIANDIPKDSRGWAFYHRQDDERRREGRSFYLTFGSNDDDEAKSKAIGEEITEILQEHGINTSWDGNINFKIEVLQ